MMCVLYLSYKTSDNISYVVVQNSKYFNNSGFLEKTSLQLNIVFN